MDRSLRHTLIVSAALHVAAVATLHPAVRQVPPRSVIEARVLPAPAAAGPVSAPVSAPAALHRPPSGERPTAAKAARLTETPIVTPTPATLHEGAVPVPVSAMIPEASTTGALPATSAAAVAAPALEPPRFDVTYLANPPPTYPASARRRGVEGTVAVDARIDRQGAAREVRLAASAGDDALDGAALDAVRHWRFVPARQGDQAVEAWVRVPLVFRLN